MEAGTILPPAPACTGLLSAIVSGVEEYNDPDADDDLPSDAGDHRGGVATGLGEEG
jgi:hypothetical protein